jgi:hypothetical protein
LLADKLLIFSQNNLFAQDVIFILIHLNSKQIILSSYRSNRQPRTNHKPPDWILFLILIPKYVHVFKSAILFSILNPTYESLFQTHQPTVRQPKFQRHSTQFFCDGVATALPPPSRETNCHFMLQSKTLCTLQTTSITQLKKTDTMIPSGPRLPAASK